LAHKPDDDAGYSSLKNKIEHRLIDQQIRKKEDSFYPHPKSSDFFKTGFIFGYVAKTQAKIFMPTWVFTQNVLIMAGVGGGKSTLVRFWSKQLINEVPMVFFECYKKEWMRCPQSAY